ncbi:glutathione S-transferase [Xanthomonas sp. XNM01]|uniref:glutathione S-transferase family protein n=1 Tax=Xanthomonas sp. XNM01 TaxID=2769289 RepID=UPI00177CE2C6|nr:glutathione S-transferase [Xanthomonas sp. XNM01]MBD9368512.1 glutathione S-transferase [Xanthomonas sp. XNM01]
MLRILGKSTSINVRKVLWACVELDLPFEREDWGSGVRDPHAPDFVALNPNAMVPVLCDGDFVLWESNAILRYLANRADAGDLYPQAPQVRARVDQWLDWQAAELNPAWSYAFQHLVRRSAAHGDLARVDASLQAWTRCMRILDAHLARSGGHVAGPGFSLADIALGLSVNRWYETPLAHPPLPAVAAYHARLMLRPGFREHGCNGTP